MTDQDNNSLEQGIDLYFTFYIFSGTGYLFCLSGTGSQIQLFSSGTGPESQELSGAPPKTFPLHSKITYNSPYACVNHVHPIWETFSDVMHAGDLVSRAIVATCGHLACTVLNSFLLIPYYRNIMKHFSNANKMYAL